MDLELQNENLRQAKRQRISDARSWKEKHARLLVRHANAEETRQAQIAYMESDEFKQQTARSWVLGHIRRDDSDDQTARYKNAFKTNYAMFSQDCISNAKTARGATRLLDACGLPGIKMPARSTICMFKIIEGEGNLVEWLQSGKITLFGINTGGSKRGDRTFMRSFCTVGMNNLMPRSGASSQSWTWVPTGTPRRSATPSCGPSARRRVWTR